MGLFDEKNRRSEISWHCLFKASLQGESHEILVSYRGLPQLVPKLPQMWQSIGILPLWMRNPLEERFFHWESPAQGRGLHSRNGNSCRSYHRREVALQLRITILWTRNPPEDGGSAENYQNHFGLALNRKMTRFCLELIFQWRTRI
jgi:hypothetical protein